MRLARWVVGLPLLAVAVLGTLVGHWITYVLATPQQDARARLLSRTGHGYLPLLIESGVILLSVGFGVLVARHENGPAASTALPPPRRLLALLILLQAGIFVSMEVLERVGSGASVADLLHGPLLISGLAVQVAVALLSAAVLSILVLFATRVALALNGRPRDVGIASLEVLVTSCFTPTSPLLVGAGSVRGPPSS